MRSSRATEVSRGTSAQLLADHNIGTDSISSWKSLSQSKAALRHIENRLEAGPGTSVLLDSVMDPPKKKSAKPVHRRDEQQFDDTGGSSKYRGHRQTSPKKSSSRSPLRNATQDSNVRKNNGVEFREPLASYREATPPPHPSAQLEAYTLQSVPGSWCPSSPPPSDSLPSQSIYQRDARDRQTHRDLDSTHASAQESTEVRYLNDQLALDTLKTVINQSHPTGGRLPAREGDSAHKAQFSQSMDTQELTAGSAHRGDSTPSSSPGSASQRLENLRRHQPDDKLEKLKERIRRQRQHLEEAAEREKLLSNLERPIMPAERSGTRNVTKVRKVAAAPPAPIYKGFNSTETNIRIPDGKVLKEQDFHHLSREIYRDLSQQFAESTRSRHQQQREREQRADRSKERRPSKPVRKVHRAASASDTNAKPAISPASWREGQKVVKMILGPVPKLQREDKPQPDDRLSRTAPRHRSTSEPRSEPNHQSRHSSTDRAQSVSQGPTKACSPSTSNLSPAAQDKAPVGLNADQLSADIQGILDDLQLECKATEKEERARQRSRTTSGGRRGRGGSVPQTRTPVSVWGTNAATVSSARGCRSASPATRRPESANTAEAGQKRRHYDADTVRQYIARQQEERKRRQTEEKRVLREEAERRNQRLQELYRKQRQAAKAVALPSDASVAPVQKRLQETYTKLLLEEAQLGKEATQMQPTAASQLMPQRPVYQPSGESDKENKRLEPPESPSSSDRSLNDQPAPVLTRSDLDAGVASFFQPDHLSPAAGPTAGPSSSPQMFLGDHFLSQLFTSDIAISPGDFKHTPRPATASSQRSQSKMSRIEAIKASAAVLSNRIESEARKFAGDGINYGATTSVDVDATLDPRFSQTNHDDGSWAEAAARAPTQNDDVALRIQRILHSAGHSSYNGTALPGAGNLHAFRGQKEKNGSPKNRNETEATSVHAPGYLPHSYPQERRRLSNGLERMDKSPRRGYEAFKADVHDSSAGSISEGPLSEGSLSDEEAIPLHSSNSRVPRAADCLESVAYCAGQRKDYQRLSEFQKEAAKCSPFSSSFAQQDGGKAAWEELSKGSPLSVINIFTRNLHSHVKADERSSPSAHSVHSGNHPRDAAVYEDDFVSSHSSGASGQLRKGSNSPSVNSHFEELMRRSPFDKNGGGFHSHHSSVHSPHLSSGSTSGSSPQSRHSSRKLGTASDQSGATLVGEERSSCSPPSKAQSTDSRKRSSDISSSHSQAKNFQGNDTALSGHSHQSVGLNGKKSPAARHRHASPFGSPDSGSPRAAESPGEPLRTSSLVAEHGMNAGLSGHSGRTETRVTSELHYSPAVLQQRMAAELQYLESIEESVRQLGDVERLMGVSMAQQESASLAQMLKAKQQCHERDLYELKIKAEREALEAKLQLEENRQRVARAHIELQESLAVTQKETLESFQDATTKMMSQQAEAARYTADTARHIKEMTEMARSQVTGVLTAPPVAPETHISLTNQQRDNSDSDSLRSDDSRREIRPKEPESSLNSLSQSDSLSFRRPKISGTDSSSHHSPLHISTNHMDHLKKETAEVKRRKGGDDKRTEGGAGSSSIEEEVPTAANDSLCSDSIPSIIDEKGETTSVATEYSHKFDESMTEDEIEERSFRSLLPSEAHRRGTLEKRPRHHEESEDDAADHNSLSVSGSHSNLKDASMPFAGGQDSFSQFTMDMVRQYMKDEEVRLQHQSSLLGLRQKALKEKIRTELAWLEHQKKKLRDKGEDDKMPPIRKKQRGLLLRLQQEQAEIKRLQEANKAARKEQQLLLKQQEEIERMRSSTMRLKERLKCAGCEEPPETPIPETPVSEAASHSSRHGDENLTPSPAPSISGSETSSIMQKLKKMRSHMDEKFLTKREQQLMQRRRHAEELLQWKQRLDQEEAEVRRIEKEALAGWDKDRGVPESQKKEKKQISDISASSSRHRSSEPRTDSEKEYVSEGDCSSVTPESSIHTEEPGSQQSRSPSAAQIASVPETPLGSIQSSPPNYTQDFTSTSPSPSKQSPTFKGSHSPAPSPSDGSSKSKMLRSSQISNQARTQSSDTPMASQEPISDQSDIESRIKALKEELRKRKFMAYQLKKEQKKRNKERLKAQEASLLKQLESYNNYIEKTKAELNKEPDSTPNTKSQNKDSNSVAERSSIKSATDRSESSRIPDFERKQLGSSLDHNSPHQADDNRSTSAPVELSDEDIPTVTPTPVSGSPECPTLGLRSHQSSSGFSRPSSKKSQAQITESGDENAVSDQMPEELEVDISSKLEDQYSEGLLKLDMEDRLDAQEHPSEALIATRDSSESEEIAKSSVSVSSKSHFAAVDNKTSQQRSPSLNDHSHSPDSDVLSSKKKASSKEADPSPSADGYNDDFESSGDSSPRDGQHSSKPTSPSSVFLTKVKSSRKDSASRLSQGDSIDEEVEDISEELSRHSGTSGPSNESGRLLDLHRQTEDSKHDSKSSNSTPSPPISPIKDEMASFNIGDRVLVGSVQPGTLRFKGATSFANGFWAGVELDKSEGSNNGTYDGVVYFECDARHGIFAPPDKISHLPDKFEVYTDTTEDEDSFFDDVADKGGDKRKVRQNKSQNQGNLNAQNEEDINKNYEFEDKKATDEVSPKAGTQHQKLPISNGNIMLDLEETPEALLISDIDRMSLKTTSQKEVSALVEKGDVELTPADASVDVRKDKAERRDRDSLDTLADTLIKNFVADTVKQFAEIKKAKEQKIQASNQTSGGLFENDNEEWLPSVEQKDDLPFFLSGEKEELSSPELCNRPESPVLGASGQEELAKRLAELELSRELLDEIGDDQDWFDEDFGLSSRREQQRLKQKQREEEEEARLGPARSDTSADGEQQAKTPPRPALPLPMPPKLPEQPAMVVPHSATEVEKMVHAAVQEMWEGCGLANNGTPSLAKLPCPKPSKEYFGEEAGSQDQEALSIRSYRKAVYDLTWEILQEIYAEDPNADQPQWVKPRRARSSHFHRVKTPGDITKIQEFISSEVLKLYGLAKDQSQKTDWQKMLKFGRKKRDRVDHILVQELHEEEVQWVNYDEDELFVKMQLADSIFDALLKDTANVLSLISDKRARRGTLS